MPVCFGMRGGSENEEEIGIPLASSDERAQKQRKVPKALREAATKDWRWLLWDSNVAYAKIHPELGARWTAVLKEACCVRKDVDKDKVNRLRTEGDRGPWRLWPEQKKVNGFFERYDFKGMVPTVPLLEWCVKREYKPDAWTFQATARGGDMDAIRWLHEHKCPWNDDDGRIWN